MTSVTSNFEAKKLNSPIQRQLIIRFRIKKKKKLNCFVQFSNLKSVCVCVQMKGKNRDIFKKLKKRPQMAQRGKNYDQTQRYKHIDNFLFLCRRHRNVCEEIISASDVDGIEDPSPFLIHRSTARRASDEKSTRQVKSSRLVQEVANCTDRDKR